MRATWQPARSRCRTGQAGTDLLPEIEHIVVLMMENHSYDNYLGMLRAVATGSAGTGRAAGCAQHRVRRGRRSAAHRMPSTVQRGTAFRRRAGTPSTCNGARARCDGFVTRDPDG